MSAASAVNLKRVTLELGGKSPLVIFNDADGKYLDLVLIFQKHFLWLNNGKCLFF